MDFDFSVFLQNAIESAKSFKEALFTAICRSGTDIYSDFPGYFDNFVNSSLDYVAILYDDSVAILKSLFPN